MPYELVQPAAGPRHEERRAIFDPPLNIARALFLAVNNHGLLGGDLQHLLTGDFLVDARVEPDFRGSSQMLLPPVTETDDQIIPRVCDMMDHPLELAPPIPHPLGTGDHVHRAVRIPQHETLALFDNVEPHA